MKNSINTALSIRSLNEMNRNTMMEHLGIEVTAVGEDFIEARMPVDHRTHQPFGLLHGGASVALAESLGSMGAYCTLSDKNQHCVGVEINANHIKAIRSGQVIGVARPLHLGSRTQVWEIRITNEQKELICISRITMAIIDKR